MQLRAHTCRFPRESAVGCGHRRVGRSVHLGVSRASFNPECSAQRQRKPQEEADERSALAESAAQGVGCAGGYSRVTAQAGGKGQSPKLSGAGRPDKTDRAGAEGRVAPAREGFMGFGAGSLVGA